MRAMLLGSGGMLGHDLATTVPSTVKLLPYSRAELDITDAKALAVAVATAHPDVIINAAAYTKVDRAETERDLAFQVNGEAVGHLGRIAVQVGAKVVHYSTDYVFDGAASQPYTEESPTNPVNAYGASKLAGEVALRQSGAQALTLRSQWLFGVHGRSFVRTMYERATASLQTRVVTDQTGRPTSTRDLASVSWRLIDHGVMGVVHAANAGQATWFDLAAHVFAWVGRRDLLQPCTTVDYPTPARRPRYSVLDTRRLEQLLNSPMPSFGVAVDDVLQRLRP